MLYAEDFSPNTPQGACPHCHGLGRVYEVTEKLDGAGRLADHPRARRSPPGRRPGTARTCATSWSRWATTSTCRGASCRRRTATGSCSPTSSRPCRCTPASRRRRRARRCGSKDRAELHGHLHRRAQVRAADLRDHAERADEAARRALHGRRALPGVRRQAAEAEALSVTFAGVDIGSWAMPLDAVADCSPGGARRAGAAAARRGARVGGARTASANARRAPRRLGARGPPTCAARQSLRREAASLPSASPATSWRGSRRCEPRPGLPVARPQHADALARRAAAAPAGDADPLEPVRRRLRARRALGRAASGRQRGPAARARAS